MHADDIPTDVTKLVYTCPLSISKAVSQNEVAALLAHYWPAIEKHVREVVAEEIEAAIEHPNGPGYHTDGMRNAARMARADNPRVHPHRD